MIGHPVEFRLLAAIPFILFSKNSAVQCFYVVPVCPAAVYAKLYAKPSAKLAVPTPPADRQRLIAKGS